MSFDAAPVAPPAPRRTFVVSDESSTPVHVNADDHSSAAAAYVATGAWDERASTWWCSVVVNELGADGHPDPDTEQRHTVPVEPLEPRCLDHLGHRWERPHRLVGGLVENPGVVGHGGGVIVTSVCVRCGCSRIVDTWATDPNTGRQGLTSTAYDQLAYDWRGVLDAARELDAQDVLDSEIPE